MFTLDASTAPRAIVYAHMPPTAAFAWPLLATSSAPGVGQARESHAVGAFKVRGGLVHLVGCVSGATWWLIISATRGNHGQSLAFAGRAVVCRS